MSARVSKPWIESYPIGGGKRRPKVERRYSVAFRVGTDGPGKAKVVKVRGFENKGLAETFAEHVDAARLRHGGWSFDGRWHPVHVDERAASDRTTVFDLIEAYRETHWHDISPSQRSKLRGRLIVTAALLSDAEGMAEALEEQDPRKGKKRPEPKTPAGWAARYLRDFGPIRNRRYARLELDFIRNERPREKPCFV